MPAGPGRSSSTFPAAAGEHAASAPSAASRPIWLRRGSRAYGSSTRSSATGPISARDWRSCRRPETSWRHAPANWGLDTLRFGYVAASAGTPLAADEALSQAGCRFFVGYNGIYDLTRRIDGSRFPEEGTPYLAPFSDGELRDFSPVNRIGADPPTVALFHGRADRTISWKQSQLFCDAVRAADGRAEIVLYDDARHGFFNYGKSDYHEEVTRKTAAFIFSVLGE